MRVEDKTRNQKDIRRIQVDTNETVEGSLLHFSGTRLCFIDGVNNNFIESSDQAILINGRLYVKGRNSRTVKINGKRVDLNQIEWVRYLFFLLCIL